MGEEVAYMMFWKKASREEKAIWKLESRLMVKRKRKTPDSRVEMAIVPLRPTYLMSTVKHAMIEPGTPTTDVMT